MKARAAHSLAIAGAVLLGGAVLLARSDDPPKGPKGTAAAVVKDGPAAKPGARSTSIMGTAWHADHTPIPYAKLRLRNVVSGRIHADTLANELGQFAFQSMEIGSYLVELVNDAGQVLTVGQTFSVGPGETIATFVRLGTKVPWFTGFFANAAAAVSATAAAAGVTAVAPEKMTCASPPCSTSGSH